MRDHSGHDRGGREPRGADIALERAGDRARVTVAGSFDLRAREEFIAAVRTAAGEGARVDVDLRGLEFIDSVGLSSVLVADRVVAERGGRLRVLLPDTGSVRRMFELTLLHLRLDVVTG